jgi:ABC-type glutathione transport system ATPase component
MDQSESWAWSIRHASGCYSLDRGSVTDILLQVQDLSVHFDSVSIRALDKLSFDIAKGEAIGILGESGSGKTTLAKAILSLLPSETCTVEGSVRFKGREILKQSKRLLRQIRGAQIALVSQEPELALNPVLRVCNQVDEVFRTHSHLPSTRRRQEVSAMLATVGLPEPCIHSAYPHELSGGQRQRVVIAQSLIAKPSLLIADEPTSALDNVTQAKVIALLKELKKKLQLAVIFITHNAALLSGLADRILVLREGRIVETGTFQQVYWEPEQAYTQSLTRCMAPLPVRTSDWN